MTHIEEFVLIERFCRDIQMYNFVFISTCHMAIVA